MYGHRFGVDTAGATYWGSTVNPQPDITCCIRGVRGLPLEQAHRASAFHEAGHATAGHLLGLTAPRLTLELGPPCSRCGAVDVGGHHFSEGEMAPNLSSLLTMLAAGVQSELLWLDRSGLLTEARGWYAEAAGISDQAQAQQSARSVGVELVYERPGDAPWDWNYRLQELRAMRLLDEHWSTVTRLAEALDAVGELTVDQVTEVLTHE